MHSQSIGEVNSTELRPRCFENEPDFRPMHTKFERLLSKSLTTMEVMAYDLVVHTGYDVSENNENILLLGDFNINLFKQPPSWNNVTSLFGLDQLVEEATRVTKSSAAFINHIYTNNRSRVSDVRTVEPGISDHCALFCQWSLQLPKPSPTVHTIVTFRSFKHFSETNFLFDLSQQPFRNVYNHCGPEEALALWYDTFKAVIDSHVLVQQKRIKKMKPCP